MIQPILVRRLSTDTYELIAGERRFRAATHLKMADIPAIIHDVDDVGALELALIENLQRENLNPIEEARAFHRLSEEFGHTQEQIATKIGKDRTAITNTLRLLKLPEPIQRGIADGSITAGHATAILSLKETEAQLRLYDQIIAGNFSVREAEKVSRPNPKHRAKSRKNIIDPHLRTVEEDLQRILGSKVSILAGKKRGKIIIEYYSPDDLERILKVLGNE